MLRGLLTGSVVLTLCGCTNIVASMQPPVYVSPLTYAGYSCAQLQTEDARLSVQIANDSSLAISGFRNLTSGKNAAGNQDVAEEKGQQQAVESVIASKHCQPLPAVATAKTTASAPPASASANSGM